MLWMWPVLWPATAQIKFGSDMRAGSKTNLFISLLPDSAESQPHIHHLPASLTVLAVNPAHLLHLLHYLCCLFVTKVLQYHRSNEYCQPTKDACWERCHSRRQSHLNGLERLSFENLQESSARDTRSMVDRPLCSLPPTGNTTDPWQQRRALSSLEPCAAPL